jgi:carboxylesterase type B
MKKDTYPLTSGNYGLSDIVVALKWIQLNIEHFGGDKKLVTLLGHRAGGTLVTALTASR